MSVSLWRAALLVMAGLAIGASAGLAVGLRWAAEPGAWRPRIPANSHRAYDQRSRDPQQWREDSAVLAAARVRFAAGRQPREVRRVQAVNTCAISFEIR